MKITGTIWLQKIIDKLANKHHITQDEVEQVLANHPQYRLPERGKIDGEDELILGFLLLSRHSRMVLAGIQGS